MTDLKGKIVFITGGSEGYGKATAKLFTEEGAIVIIAARNISKLEQAKREIQCKDIISMDVTCPADWERAYDYVFNKYGKLDILVNNAGGGVSIKETTEQSIEDINKIIALNLNGTIFGSRVFGKLMKLQKSGSIINISSGCAKEAWPEWTVYAAAKWGVLGFSKGLYTELQPHNVRVTCVIPGAASAESTSFRKSCDIPDAYLKLQSADVARVIVDICKLPPHVVIEETTIWGIDQIIIPL